MNSKHEHVYQLVGSEVGAYGCLGKITENGYITLYCKCGDIIRKKARTVEEAYEHSI